MHQATRDDVPSEATRALIRAATDVGRSTARQVSVFTESARRAVRAYDAEVNPLDLEDEDYLAVEEASGMNELLTIAADMEVMLTGVFDRAA